MHNSTLLEKNKLNQVAISVSQFVIQVNKYHFHQTELLVAVVAFVSMTKYQTDRKQ